MGDPLRIGAPHVVAPQVKVAELLAKDAVPAKPPGRGGHGGVEEAEAPVLVQARRELQVLKEGPFREAADGVERRSFGELAPVAEAEPNPRPAGAPGIEAEQGRRVVELQPKRTAARVGVVECVPDDLEAVRGEQGIGVEKEKNAPRRFLCAAAHLRSAALRSPEHGGSSRARQRPRLVLRPPIYDEGLERLFLVLETLQRGPERILLVEGGNNDRNER